MPVSLQTSGTATKNYAPTDEQVKQTKEDRTNIDNDLLYRSQFESAWKHGATKWNMVAPPDMPGVPNYVVPITRMATSTGVVSMRQDIPEVVPVPEGHDERQISTLLADASAHIHRMSNMEGVMDQAMVDFAVLGNMVLESFVEVPFKTKRVPIIGEDGKKTGKYKSMVVRDWSKPKIGTRAKSIWECAFDSGARTPADIRRCWYQERMSMAEFKEKYVDRPDNEFINLECVEAGFVWTFNDKGDLERTSVDHDRVVIDNVQNELTDSWRKYANGVLIWDVPLSEVHEHGKCTITLVPNHHKYDKNGKTHALYGTGDPELLADLDDLVNAATNMYIKNYQNKNTYVTSIEGSPINIADVDIHSGDPIAGRVTVQSLGQSDLPEWQAFKTNLEQWAVQVVKKNYMRLEGEVAKTAYEAMQKKQAENIGMEYQIKKMGASGLLQYAEKHVSDIMEHYTVEEWADATDKTVEEVNDLIKQGMLGQEDVVFSKDGLTPVKIRHMERFRTRGKVYEEGFEKGKRSLSKLKELPSMTGQDGWLPASKEYLETRSWKLYKKTPDVYLVTKRILGQDNLVELSKMEQFMGNMLAALNVLATAKQVGVDTGLDFELWRDKQMDVIGLKREELLKGEQNKELAEVDETIKAVESLIKPPSVPSQPQNEVLPAVQSPQAQMGGGGAV